jgi:hypothetical protein
MSKKEVLDPKAEQKQLESQVVQQALDCLQEMVNRYEQCDFVLVGKSKCQLTHVQETVKLAHQVRSLLGNP